MSMIGMLRRLSDTRLTRLKAHPEEIQDYLFNEVDDGDDTEPFADLDIDKSWHAIHYLLNGDPWGETKPSLGFLVAGGTEIGEDNGYGPARGFRSDEVRSIQRALAAVDANTLRERFDASALEANEIYPSGWKQVQDTEYWTDYFEQMKSFIDDAVANGEALLVWLT